MELMRLISIVSVVLACISSSSASQSTGKFVLGADFGTESVRVGIFDRSDGRLVDSHSVPYATQYPANGFAEQNPSDWWNNFCEACNALFKNGKCSPSDIGAVSVDTTACSVVALDDNFRYVSPPNITFEPCNSGISLIPQPFETLFTLDGLQKLPSMRKDHGISSRR